MSERIHEQCRVNLNALIKERDALKGAMTADEERLRNAEIRAWGEAKWGCDAPEMMAETIEELRAEVARLKERECVGDFDGCSCARHSAQDSLPLRTP